MGARGWPLSAWLKDVEKHRANRTSAAPLYAPPRAVQDALRSRQVEIDSPQMEQSRVWSLFDGDLSTLGRTEALNPAVIRIAFPAPVRIEYVRVATSHGDHVFSVAAADTIADLRTGQKTFRKIVSERPAQESGAGVRLEQPVTARAFQLTVRRVTGDNYVHINEWELCRSARLTGLRIIPAGSDARLYPGWEARYRLQALCDDGATAPAAKQEAAWTAADPAVATVANGLLTARSSGQTQIRARQGTLSAELPVSIERPVLPPQEETFTDLAKPMPGAQWEVPFVVVNLIPTPNGRTVDEGITGWKGSVAALKARCLRLARNTKWMLEEGSRFHGYRDPAAKPALGYRCVKYVTLYEPAPHGTRTGTEPPVYFPDYAQIVRRMGGEQLVNGQGVKEFWIYHWHHGDISPVETNLASPLTGDISNSDRREDLPLFKSTYMVVGVNFARGPDKHVHNIGHQMESVLSHIAERQDGSSDLFWKRFCGMGPDGKFQPGRAGTCHHPPNARKDYDYYNDTPADSDIEDWKPDGTGARKPVSRKTWESLDYRFPTGDRIRMPGTVLEDDAQWYLYWFQNFPGRGSRIPHPKGEMTNWWRFLGDYDGAIREKYGLWKAK
ncbi:MAG: hypothetical protein K0Q72_3022 [Armatimonadetes bacterium]|nr:hypothetical protein [Armatimonadota bacterium]